MAIVISDITEGTIRRDMNGWSATRVFDVEDPGGSDIAKPYTAIQGIGSSHGVSYGAAHPVIPGIRVSSMSVEHVDGDPDVYRVSVEYSGDAEGSAPSLIGSGIKGIEVNSGSVTAQTNRDYRGNLMQVTYQGREIIFRQVAADSSVLGVGDSPYADQRIQLVHTTPPVVAEYDIPTVTVIVTVERNVPSHIESMRIGHTVNGAAWSGGGAYQWLLFGIDSQLNDTGSYDWRYILGVAPQTTQSRSWRFAGEVKSPFADRVYIDTAPGNGIAEFDVYRPIDFRQQLGFELPHG